MSSFPSLACVLVASAGLILSAGCVQAQRPAADPGPPSGLARTALAHPAFRWDSLAGPGLTTYLRSGSYAASRADDLHARTGDALRHALALLGESAYPAHLRVFYVGSRDDMVPITGGRHTGTTDAGAHAVALVENESWRAFTRHEVMHAVSLLLWGQPGGAEDTPQDSAAAEAWRRGGWLREGLAAAAENRCGPYTNRGASAVMQGEGTLIPIGALAGSFYEQDDLAAYLQAGSLVEYLLGTYGRERFQALWRSGSVEVAYDKRAAVVGAEWAAWLRSAPPKARPESTAALRARGCG